jgi:RNA polymerase sigma-70 factor (ECF subfamily)
VATCTLPATAAKAILVEKSERDANKLSLAQRARRGDGDAFAELFELNKRRVYCLCLSMTKDASEAEDLTQEAFLQVFRNVATFRGDSALSTWVYRIAINTVLMKRRRKCPPMFSLDEPVSPDSPSLRRELGARDANLSSVIDRITLNQAIRELPAGCRTILGLHAIHGYQHREIAELLQCSIGNSKSQLHTAKLKMRRWLSPGRSAARLRRVVGVTQATTNRGA